MYLPIGMNVYVRSERIVGIFETAYFQEMLDAIFMQQVTVIDHELEKDMVKSYIITSSNEVHWSNVNCRTLKKRWKHAMRNSSRK